MNFVWLLLFYECASYNGMKGLLSIQLNTLSLLFFFYFTYFLSYVTDNFQCTINHLSPTFLLLSTELNTLYPPFYFKHSSPTLHNFQYIINHLSHSLSKFNSIESYKMYTLKHIHNPNTPFTVHQVHC